LFRWDGGQGVPQVLSFFLLGAWTLVDPGFHQRVASAASPEIGRKGVLVSAACWMVFDLLSMSTAMYALALMPSPDAAAGPLERLSIFPEFGSQVLPPGLRGLFFLGMLGTILSAMVGYALVSGATLGRDIVSRLIGAGEDVRVNLWTKLGIVVSCIAAIVLALTVESVVSLWYSWGGAVVGALLLPVALAYGIFPKSRCPSAWIVAATVLAAAASFSLLAYGLATGNPFLTVALSVGGTMVTFGLGTLLPGLLVSGLVIGIGEGAAIIASNGHDGRPSSR
jgi:SSS family solute:Na+ symporter